MYKRYSLYAVFRIVRKQAVRQHIFRVIHVNIHEIFRPLGFRYWSDRLNEVEPAIALYMRIDKFRIICSYKLTVSRLVHIPDIPFMRTVDNNVSARGCMDFIKSANNFTFIYTAQRRPDILAGFRTIRDQFYGTAVSCTQQERGIDILYRAIVPNCDNSIRVQTAE